MRVLHITNYFHPATAWGGPVVAMHAICNHLAAIDGLDQSVLTTDSLGPNTRGRIPRPTDPVRYDAGYDVYYSRVTLPRFFSVELLGSATALARKADVVHVTGVYTFNALWGLWVAGWYRKPVVWSARGGIQAFHEFTGASRPWAKRVFISAARALLGRARSAIHCTSEAEVEAMQAAFPDVPTRLVPNGVDHAPIRGTRGSGDGPLRLLFLSRLDPKKGIETLIEALGMLDGPVTLDICGEGRPGYETTLRAMIARAGLAGAVTFHGHVEGEAREQAFANADLFVLPSHSENFGNVIAEALVRGVPVITTTGTPWQELETRGCGRWIERDAAVLARTIEEMRTRDLGEMGRIGHHWMAEEFSWASRAQGLHGLYGDLIAGGQA